MRMTKKDLENGMFGVTSEGCFFVVVDGILVYQDGQYDELWMLHDDLSFGEAKIMKLFDCNCFNAAKNNEGCIYDREKDTVHEMTISEIEKALGISNLKIKKETK